MTITKLPEMEMTQGFDLRGMNGLDHLCIEGFKIENSAMAAHITLNYCVDKDFPLKSLLRFDAHNSYNTDEAVLEIYDQNGKHLFVLTLADLHLHDVAWAFSAKKIGIIELKLRYTIGRII